MKLMLADIKNNQMIYSSFIAFTTITLFSERFGSVVNKLVKQIFSIAFDKVIKQKKACLDIPKSR